MIYIHPQEIWDTKECFKRARYAPKDAWGNCTPKGIIASNASNHAQYGQTIYHNGGIFINSKWYTGEHKPLPIIPNEFEFVRLPAWGIIIRKKP